MTIKDIAKSCFALAKSLGLKESQKEMFAARIMTECLFDSVNLPPVSQTPRDRKEVVSIPESKAEVKKRVKKMVESVATPPPKLLCKEGRECSCDVCKKVVYLVKQDMYDGMKASEFASCLTPIGHNKPLPDEFRLRAIDGCVMTDCPVCGGDMSLVLWGRRPERDFDEGGVSSTGNIA